MNTRCYWLLSILVVFVVGCGPPAPTKNPQLAKSRFPTWAPDQELIVQLDEVVHHEKFSIQPPIGFASNHQLMKGLYQWAGPRRRDRTSAVLQVVVSEASRAENLNKRLQSELNAIKRLRSNWSESTLAAGEIDGFKFLKKSWAAEHRGSGAVMNGVVYFGQADNLLVCLKAQEAGSNRERNLKVCEAALLTFRKAHAKSSVERKLGAATSDRTEVVKISAAEMGAIKDGVAADFDGYSFALPADFQLDDAPQVRKGPRGIKIRFWTCENRNPPLNAMFLAASIPMDDGEETARQALVNFSSGFTDQVGIEIQQRGRTREFDSPVGTISGFRFFGTTSMQVLVTGEAYIIRVDKGSIVFMVVTEEGDHEEIAEGVVSGLATLRMSSD